MVWICIIEVHMGFMIVLRLNKAFSKPDDATVISFAILTATFPVRVPTAWLGAFPDSVVSRFCSSWAFCPLDHLERNEWHTIPVSHNLVKIPDRARVSGLMDVRFPASCPQYDE